MRSWGQLGLLGAALLGALGCSEATDPADEAPSGAQVLSQLSAVEVTTVTTVQASTGVFLSPRPLQVRPPYVELGLAGTAGAESPSAELDRAKVDSALLFGSASGDLASARLSATFSALAEQDEPLPQHFFPALEARGHQATWPLLLQGRASNATDTWTEWDGWQAFEGLSVTEPGSTAAPAATLDYEMVGLSSPLVLGSDGRSIVITNRSQLSIAKALLIYAHENGVGISVVADLGPGMRRETTLGPKERNPEELLRLGRIELESFLGESMGPELGRAVARAKSVPFLETLGLRLIYLLDEQQGPAALTLPAGLSQQRRFVISHAEVLEPADEERVVALLQTAIQPREVPEQLGRFARAKLEVAGLLGDEQVRQQSSTLLQSLAE
jgi:hypothetical protein